MFLNKKARAQFFFLAFLQFSLGFFAAPVFARMLAPDTSRPLFSGLAKLTALPNLDQCTHKTGRLWFTVTNYGILGNRRNVFLRDCLTGGPSSSAEFPGGSGVEYLYQGALWVGGIVGADTLVSTGTDGWADIREFFPGAGTAATIERRSASPNSPYYSPEAVSDQDFIAVYYDTLTDPRLVSNPDPDDGRAYKPLGLKVEQRSYSWASTWGQDWVLLDYTITNIGKDPIRRAYVGFFMDQDVGNSNSGLATHLDDYCGFLSDVYLKDAVGYFNQISPSFLACRETLNLAYAYDNDGDPDEGGYGTKSPTGVLGVKFLRAREAVHPYVFRTPIAFNWWVPDANGRLDWGPQHLPGRANFYGGFGQPMGDAMKYYYLSNREIDYDQVYSALDYGVIDRFSAGIWRPPPEFQNSATDIARGADSRFLLSAGPFDLDVGESVPVTLAVIVAPGFHEDPTNYAANFPTPSDFLNPAKISAYKSHLNLNALVEDSRMARKVFDNETVHSPITCQFTLGGPIQDSSRMHGDGIPDFKGPPPPPYPKVEVATEEGEVTLRWFGRETENTVDPISGLRDFEGYMVEMSPDGVNYTVVGYFDKVNWRVHYLNWDFNGNGRTDPNNSRDPNNDSMDVRWEPLENRPLTYDEIQNYYGVRWDTCLNHPGDIRRPIDPQKYNSLVRTWGINPPPLPYRYSNPWCNPDTDRTAIRVRFCDNCGPLGHPVDTILYFEPEGPNLGLDKARMYPSVTDPNNDSAYWYQYKMTGLLPSQPIYVAVVPFDNGLLTYYQRIDPQAPPVTSVARLVYPMSSDSARRAEGLKISVYPNPYRIDNDYSFFEKRQPVSGRPQSSKRINFANLPPRCTIRIYTLDGDLVQQIDHDKAPGANDSGLETWDLLTRNAQMVTAGLYIFSVESKEGRYIGKMVIIQ